MDKGLGWPMGYVVSEKMVHRRGLPSRTGLASSGGPCGCGFPPAPGPVRVRAIVFSARRILGLAENFGAGVKFLCGKSFFFLFATFVRPKFCRRCRSFVTAALISFGGAWSR